MHIYDMGVLDTHHMYTVKSGYHRLSSMASPSSMVQPSFLWNSIWNLKVPQNIKIIPWRVCSGILPTLDNFPTKKIAVVNVCPVCNGGGESAMHLLVACSFEKRCWRLSSLPLAIKHFDTFQDWLFETFNVWDAQSRALDYIIIWKLWTHKKNLVWRNKGSLPHNLINEAKDFLTQYREAQSVIKIPAPTSTTEPVCNWAKPE